VTHKTVKFIEGCVKLGVECSCGGLPWDWLRKSLRWWNCCISLDEVVVERKRNLIVLLWRPLHWSPGRVWDSSRWTEEQRL